MISRRYVLGAAATMGVAGALLASTLQASASPGFPGYALSTNGSLTPAGSVSYVATQSGDVTFTVSGIILRCPASSASTASGSVNRGTYTTNQVGTIASTAFGAAKYTGARTGGGSISGANATNSCTTTNNTVPVAVVGPEGAPNGGGPRSNTSPATVWPAWTINVTALSTTQPNPQGVPLSGQVTPGSIENIRATVYVGGTNSCHFEVGGVSPNGVYTTTPDNSTSLPGGKVYGTYTNTSGTGTLSINPNDSRTSLYVWNVSNPTSGCVGGAIKNGNVAKFGGPASSAPVTSNAVYSVSATTSSNNPIWVRS